MLRILLAILVVQACATSQAAALEIYTEVNPIYQYVDANGELYGVSIEIVREVQRRLGDTTKIQVMPWARAYEVVLQKPNSMLFTTIRTPEREQLFKWVGPLFTLEYAFYKKAGNPLRLNSLEDAKKVGVIGTVRNDFREQTLKRLGFTNLVPVAESPRNVKKLMLGRIDLMVEADHAIKAQLEGAGYSRDDVVRTVKFMDSDSYLAFSRGSDDQVVERWRHVLQGMSEDGSLQSILRKWSLLKR